MLTSRIAGASIVVGRAPLPDGAVDAGDLRRRGVVHVRRLGGNAAAQQLGTLPARTLSAEEIGRRERHHFTGVVIGLYATGHGKRATVPADFDWFEYAPL